MRMNTRLVRASQFIQQFNLDIRHKSEKNHVISDALFRLASINENERLKNEYSKLDVLSVNATIVYAFNATLIQMNESFRKKLINNYKEDEI